MIPTQATIGYLAVYNPETVILRVKDSEAGRVPYQVDNAKRRVEDRFATDATGVKECVWHLWAAMIQAGGGTSPGYTGTPKKGDEIVDSDGVVWAIYRVQVMSWGSRFRCQCKRL